MKGIVFPANWDRNGKVMQVILDTEDQGQYVIENKGVGKALWRFLSCEVEVQGTEKRDESGNIILSVSSYHLLEDSETGMAA